MNLQSYIYTSEVEWRKMRITNLLLIVIVVLSSIPSAQLQCSKIVIADEENPFFVRKRFLKLTKDIAGKLPLKATFIHRPKENDGKGEEYDYEFRLCPDSSQQYLAVKQTTKTGKVSGIGRSNDSFVTGGVDWLLIKYGSGDYYHSHCNKNRKQAWVTVRCEDEGRKQTFRVIEEKRHNNGVYDDKKNPVCYYLFEYNHPAACSDSSVKTEKKLSGGSIFCIVVVCLAAVYLIGGFLYQRFYAGAKGFEQIPNYSFWREVGNLSSDGCDFICRRPDHPANTYKGMTDALNIDSSDDEKDDHLLPM